MRRIGCLLFLILVAGGLFAADLLATQYLEQRTARETSRTLDADTVVDLEGWPVGVRALMGTIPQATVVAEDVPLDNGASLDRLDVVLRDVDVDVNRLGDPDRLPAARSGEFEAVLGEEGVVAMLGLPSGVADVTLEQGVVRVRAAGLEVEADVEARDGNVIVSLAGPLEQLLGGAEYPIDLSQEPGSPYVEEVEIRDGRLFVRGVLDDVSS